MARWTSDILLCINIAELCEKPICQEFISNFCDVHITASNVNIPQLQPILDGIANLIVVGMIQMLHRADVVVQLSPRANDNGACSNIIGYLVYEIWDNELICSGPGAFQIFPTSLDLHLASTA